MQTLKKVLALSLVFAFAFTMMAGATIFTDDSGIDAQDQVDLVYALGIIKGYPDGSFGPEKTITRAEAAKMIYVIKTGKDVGSDNYKNAANPFSDVASTHWAKGYINYCYLNGIIAGVGGGKFNPEGQVTGAQLAKMLLTVIGYDATKAGLVGDQWLISTMSLAFEHDLFDDFDAEVSAAAPREDAAIIFYNTIYALTVTYRDDEYVTYDLLGADNKTVGEKNFNLTEYEGVLIAAESLNAVSGLGAADETIILDEDCDTTYSTFGVAAGVWAGTADDNSLDYDGGLEYLGQYVKVLYDDNKDVVYNIVPAGDNVVINTIDGSIGDGSGAGFIDYADDDYGYTLGTTPTFVNYDPDLTYDFDSTSKTNDPVKLVDYDGDDTIDYAFVTSYTFGYVSSLDSKSIDFGVGAKKFVVDDETYVYADGIEEGDYVLYYYDDLKDVYYVEAATAISATIGGTRGTDVKVNGAYLAKSTKATAVVEEADPALPDIGDDYTIYTDGKYYLGFISEESSIADAGDFALVIDVTNKSGSGLSATDPEVLVLIPGEDDPVDYVLDSGTVYTGAGTLSDITLTNMDNVDSTVGTQTNIINKVFAYSINSDGEIELSQDFANYTGQTIPVVAYTAVGTGAVALEYDEDTDVFTNTTAAPDVDYLLADDAVIFYYVGGDWEIYGANDFDTDITTGQADLCAVAYKTSGGFKYIQTAVIADGVWNAFANVGAGTQDGGTSDTLYGYMLSDAMLGYDSDADEDYVEYTIWNGAETTIIDSDTTTIAVGAAEGAFVEYTLKTDGTIDAITTTIANDVTGDIEAYSSATDKLTVSGTIYSITDDTVVFYIDNDAVAGETGSSFPKISASAVAAGDHNVYIVTDGAASTELLLVIIDLSETL